MPDSDIILPRHIGYIIDGNRRWAKKHGIPTYEGHLAGYNTLKEIAFANLEAGIEFMSIYIFSTENWKRSQDEVKGLMSLILKLFTTDAKLFNENNARLKILGTRDGLDPKILKAMDKLENDTKDNTRGTLAICLNYGGQTEVVDAVKNIIKLGTKAEDVTEDLIAANLYGAEVPPVDIIVRTSGEKRLSNFMLWRSAYSELIFMDKMWPDMKKEDVSDIIKEYSRRQRRFGG
jgi:undecaprenyl diphosphate synthase